MYLESLDILGFKSFGRKTKFKFTDGITSIVGPNGCGKSNIVDAIRWVLGEQKAGIIRSERMENVIFNGSKSIKPLGMAEVALTVQNTKNVLPIEFSEVVITRRLFRSGESQYLLNNVPCRLKDILDLFMDTGVGSDAYSIIELSMVESILNGKVDERRRIIEEAAGVTKYKLRRRAAFRKLEATEADIVRLNDIISEVEKNVASLQRQVRKAKRYQEIKEILKEKEIQLATHEYSKINFELEPLFEKLHQTQDRRVALTAQFDEKEAEIEESRVKLLEIEKNLSTQQRELNELSSRIQKKEEEILVDRERRRALQDTKARLLRDKEEKTARIEKIQEQILQSKENLQQLFQKIQLAEGDFQEKNVALKSMEINVQDKREKRKGIENQRLQSLEGITNSRQEEERINTQLENIVERINAINCELEENELLEKIRQDKTAKLHQKKSEYEGEIQHLKKDQTILQKGIASLGEEKDSLKEKILHRRTELQTIKERIELLKKFIESYEDHPEGVQHLLLQGYLNGGCKGTLGEILTVNATYRRAIETALGEAAVSLIVEETDQALRCIEVLNTEHKGAVTFFPLDRFTTGKSHHKSMAAEVKSEQSEGIIDWAYNLVECSSDYRSLVDALLQDYLIVSDLDTAKKQANRLRHQRLSLITLNGEIISTWGPIKGGANGTTQGGVIGRKALVEELAEKSQSLFKQLENEEREHQQLENNYQQTFNREKELAKKLNTLQAQLTEVEVELAQLNFESKKETEARERLVKERATQSKYENDLKEKIQAISPSLNDFVGNKTKFDMELQQIADDLLKLETELSDCRAVVQDSRVKLVDLKGEERHLQEDIARQQEFEKELQDSLARIAAEMASASTEYAELEKRIEANKKTIQAEFDQHKHLESEVHAVEQQYLEGKEKLEAQEKFVKEIRNEKDEVSETLHSLDLRVAELKMEGNKLKEKISEEYKIQIKKQPLDETLDTEALSEDITRLKNRLSAMEPVNLLALKEYEKEKTRFDFLCTQKNDLLEAESNLNETIKVINKTAREQFTRVFEQIKQNFMVVFKGFFEDGQATLKLAPNTDPLEAEIIIEADPKGRHINTLSLLSGGEKALTAISLLFGIYLVKPSPFCILDEVDAPLDDVNIGRFLNAIRKFSNNTQFIIVTHNKLTMRAADCLYGVTMEEEGVSKVVSVNFTDMPLASPAPQAAKDS
ncbi:MAG: chromosome segregation protein SMC [bacterium]